MSVPPQMSPKLVYVALTVMPQEFTINSVSFSICGTPHPGTGVTEFCATAMPANSKGAIRDRTLVRWLFIVVSPGREF
jgi:hypothetical protein